MELGDSETKRLRIEQATGGEPRLDCFGSLDTQRRGGLGDRQVQDRG